MQTKNHNYFFLLLSYSAVLLLVVTTRHNCFFWDTVQLASKHAEYYYSNHFSSLLLPNHMDSGHIPTFGLYLALLWNVFGKSLEVSHLGMLPFALGIVWQVFKICQRFIQPEFVGLAVFLIMADPSLLSQLTLVSPDVPLLFFFFLGLNSILENKKNWIMISIFLLFLTSMRGMMVSLCLLGLDLYCNIDFRTSTSTMIKKLMQRSLLYYPALLLFVMYNGYHFLEKGWIGYHKDSPWANCFESVEDFKSFLFNTALYAWRVLDFGRFGVWLVFIILLMIYKKQLFKTKSTLILLYFTIGIMLILPLNMLWAKNLMAHRYLIPIYLTFSLLTARLLFSDVVHQKLKYGLSVLWIFCLIGGNFIIYPDKVAKGWDSTLAHLPYYELRHQAIAFLDKEQIDFKEVHSFFPNTASIDLIDLNGDQRNFNIYNNESKYVFYSNVFNIEDQTYDRITNSTNYAVLKRFQSHGVYIAILKKNDE